MSTGSQAYELFLALAPTRIMAARQALELEGKERASELEAALVPLAVDAALLGADGVSALSRAASRAGARPNAEIESALDVLSHSIEALGHGDESGARVNESELLAMAESLLGAEPVTEASVPDEAERVAPKPRPSAQDDLEAAWEPTLAEDMIAAFLDECVERLDGLSERLLALEERGGDRELVGEIFRDLHTLKGSSAFAGLKKMNRVAHLAEDRIGELRDGKRECDRALIDVLLETLDVLRLIVDKARARAPIDVDVTDLLRRLENPTLPKSAPKPAEVRALTAPSATVATAPAATATLRIDFEKVDLLLNLLGEVVLSRGRLSTAAEVQGALVREIAQLRKKLATERLGQGSPIARWSTICSAPSACCGKPAATSTRGSAPSASPSGSSATT